MQVATLRTVTTLYSTMPTEHNHSTQLNCKNTQAFI
jgi:hypothetical protein